MKPLASLRARWAALTAPSPLQTATISRCEGEGRKARAVPMVTFTFEYRGVGWYAFAQALARAEAAFESGAATLRHRGVRIDAHSGYWSVPPEERKLDRAVVLEAFKIAQRTPGRPPPAKT